MDFDFDSHLSAVERSVSSPERATSFYIGSAAI